MSFLKRKNKSDEIEKARICKRERNSSEILNRNTPMFGSKECRLLINEETWIAVPLPPATIKRTFDLFIVLDPEEGTSEGRDPCSLV